MNRETLLALAAKATHPATPEHEANTAAKILAKEIHEHPEALGVAPAIQGTQEIDPIVGFVVREGFGFAADMFRDFFDARARREPLPKPPTAPNVPSCPICRAQPKEVRRYGDKGTAFSVTCGNGHAYVSRPVAPPPKPASPGPRKAPARARTRRA